MGLYAGHPNPKRLEAKRQWNKFLDKYEWSTRTGNVLHMAGIDDEDKFMCLDEKAVLAMPNAGRKTWYEIKEMQDTIVLGKRGPEGYGVKLLREFEQAVRDDEMAGSMDPERAEMARAEFAEIEQRIYAFMREVDLTNEKVDLHTRTAMRLFDVSADEVTEAMRRVSKEYNYLRAYTPTRFG
jgi:hypothetical protein